MDETKKVFNVMTQETDSNQRYGYTLREGKETVPGIMEFAIHTYLSGVKLPQTNFVEWSKRQDREAGMSR